LGTKPAQSATEPQSVEGHCLISNLNPLVKRFPLESIKWF